MADDQEIRFAGRLIYKTRPKVEPRVGFLSSRTVNPDVDDTAMVLLLCQSADLTTRQTRPNASSAA